MSKSGEDIENDPATKPAHMDPNERHTAAKSGDCFGDEIGSAPLLFSGFF
jgi:hypothetical protein